MPAIIAFLVWLLAQAAIRIIVWAVAWAASWWMASHVLSLGAFAAEWTANAVGFPPVNPLAEYMCYVQKWVDVGTWWLLLQLYWTAWAAAVVHRYAYKIILGSK